VKDIKMSESGVNFFKNIFYGEMPPILGKDDEQYKDLRKVIRAADSALFVNADAEEHFSVRDWFTSRGIQPRPTYTCSLISHSDLILGQVRVCGVPSLFSSHIRFSVFLMIFSCLVCSIAMLN
jgi:hypothetical protein